MNAPRQQELEATLRRIQDIQRRISAGQSITDEESELCRSAGDVLNELRGASTASQPPPSQGLPKPLTFPTAKDKKKERLVLNRIPREKAPTSQPRKIEKDQSVLKTERQVQSNGYRPSQEDLTMIKEFLDAALKLDVIENCSDDDNTWTATMYVAKDDEGRSGVYFDFSALRGTIPESTAPIPPESALAPFESSEASQNWETQRFNSDLLLATYDAAWPIPLAAADRPKTAFRPPFPSSSPYGRRYRFKMAPMDMPGTNAAIQNVMEEAVFDGLCVNGFASPNGDWSTALVVVRLNRVYVRGGLDGGFENHLRLLSEVITRVKMAGLRFSKEDCRVALLSPGESAGAGRKIDSLKRDKLTNISNFFFELVMEASDTEATYFAEWSECLELETTLLKISEESLSSAVRDAEAYQAAKERGDPLPPLPKPPRAYELDDTYDGPVDPKLSCLVRIRQILEKYREMPNLLDPYLERMITPVAEFLKTAMVTVEAIPVLEFRNKACWDISQLFRVMYWISNVRGAKTLIKFLTHEAADLEPTLSFIPVIPDYFVLWSSRYIVLLWLSLIVMIPFDLSKIDSAYTPGDGTRSSVASRPAAVDSKPTEAAKADAEDDDESFVPSEIEEVVEILLIGLRDKVWVSALSSFADFEPA
ncbi:hypothetical protein HDU96_002743 [Phlyctochytrium bullatum]|nr:hypothetical protein HDU96_002743 [Phlyctochytrium bullatum]